MKDLAELVASIAALLWPVLFLVILIAFRNQLKRLFDRNAEFLLEVPGGKFQIKPSSPPRAKDEPPLPPPDSDAPLPFDYLYLNHTSFLRPKMQEEFKARTGVDSAHYDIRVLVDSYYTGALSKISRVEYYLHQSFPNPIQVRTNCKKHFLLKELANGEFIIQAKVFIEGRKAPILLQRYLTLWNEGPRLE